MPNLLTIDLDKLTTEEQCLIHNIVDKNSPQMISASVFSSPFMFASGGGVYFPLYWSVPPEVNFIYSVGNIYGNKTDAEFSLEREKVLKELRDLSTGSWFNRPDWRENTRKYNLEYNANANIISFDWWTNTSVCPSTYTFSTSEDAHSAIRIIGNDRLKKYYFEIE